MENKNNRLLSIDALRGLDMFLLVGIGPVCRALPDFKDTVITNFLANQFRHPQWDGFTLYDLIFPLFLFIVGISMPFSFANRGMDRSGKRSLFRHVFVRFIVLSILGALVWQQPGLYHPTYGYYSVLFRIGASYMLASIIIINCSSRYQAFWAFSLVFGYWLVMKFMPVPGYGYGDFTEEGNLLVYTRKIIAETVSPGVQYILNISIAGSVSNVLFGALAGNLVKSKIKEVNKLRWLVFGGILLAALAWLVHLDFPVNKKLGSSSFVFLTSGLGMLLFALFYWLIDVKGFKKWPFVFVVVGANSIAIYVAHYLVSFNRLAKSILGGIDFGTAHFLAVAVTMAILQWLFCYYLYKNKIFFKI
ncbi:acyltransferase family protein [Parapedobacter pyrenivorans]|nr:DUF5009 domain-containing protein [Parapedobacter pyrenivorans]